MTIRLLPIQLKVRTKFEKWVEAKHQIATTNDSIHKVNDRPVAPV